MEILQKIIEFLATDLGQAITTFLVVAWSLLKTAKVIVSLTKTTADDKVVEQVEKILLLLGRDPNSPTPTPIDAKELAGQLETKKISKVEKFWKAI